MMNDPLFIFLTVYVFIIGICVGSFLNVASLRALWGESIVFPASKCHSCGNKLKWYHNIPILSWVFLGGRCGFCKEKISIQYPITELLNGVLYTIIFLTFGITLKTLFFWVLTSFLIVISITDIKEKIVFNVHTYPVIVLGLLYVISGLSDITITESILGIITAFLFFEGLSRFVKMFVKERAFGEGDTDIAMGIGAFFGWKLILIVIAISIFFYGLLFIFPYLHSMLKEKKYKKFGLLISFILTAILTPVSNAYWNILISYCLILLLLITGIFSVCIILTELKNQKKEELIMIPFGPALVFGGFVVMFFGNQIIKLIQSYI